MTLPAAPLVQICVVHRPAGRRLTFQIDLEADVAVADDGDISIEPDRNLARFPGAVVQLTGFDPG